MVEYTKDQLRIAAFLVKGSKTMDELRDELDMPMGVLETELAPLIKNKVVKQEGYPTKYSVIEQVRQGIMGENEFEGRDFRAHIIIEGQSRDKSELVKATKNIIGKMSADKLVAVSNIVEDEVVEGEGFFSANFEADVATDSFEDMVYFVLNYGPSSIEMTEPTSFELKTDAAQEVLMDVAAMIHSYISLIAQLKVTMQDSKEVYIKDPKHTI